MLICVTIHIAGLIPRSLANARKCMTKFYRTYRAILRNMGLLIRKRAVASARRHDFMITTPSGQSAKRPYVQKILNAL